MKGTIYMLPTTLGGESTHDIIPEEVKNITIGLRHFMVEDIKSARRYLRKLDRSFPIDECTFHILTKKTELPEVRYFLKDAENGHSMGVLSEAGCPGVADPGASAVNLAHELDLKVSPLVGPSSILLTLMGSGFSGQNFCFHGYLPKDRKGRIRTLKEYENNTFRTGMTHLFMDTPFRNMNVLDDMLNELSDDTMICIANNLTIHDESVRTMSAKNWREKAYDLAKKPTMFAIGRMQS